MCMKVKKQNNSVANFTDGRKLLDESEFEDQHKK